MAEIQPKFFEFNRNDVDSVFAAKCGVVLTLQESISLAAQTIHICPLDGLRIAIIVCAMRRSARRGDSMVHAMCPRDQAPTTNLGGI